MLVIKDYIAKNGFITLDVYMQNCLHHHDYGYYRVGNPIGATGDFITAPEISQIFGELIGVFIDFHCAKLFPFGYQICELGAGRGILAMDYLRVLKQKPTDIFFLESNTYLKKEQLNRIPNVKHIDNLSMLPHKPTLFLANEFFDALPMKAFKLSQNEQSEVIINMDKIGHLKFDYASPTKNTTNKYQGYYETSADTLNFCHQIADFITDSQGAFLCCDYGYDGLNNNITFRGFKNHHLTDGLQSPYTEDLTADVNFSEIISTFRQENLIVHDLMTQANFLRALFIDKRLHELLKSVHDTEKKYALIAGTEKLLSPNEMGERFKFLFITSMDDIFYPFIKT